ncbi:hypothetical protein [Paeniglutamicibacter psychrophenolicus]|uniref:hypothetical protein n=1 Tax=Paeniglutamicibacter psychrophenolicus TaxID=257454 RepID=UPI0027841C56|nr:hypothetical protein [Paeniglutamicibacter psychrophenolicus]MDQ0095152.1 hypothetical protein [Paeniglutamicibacter psychrophenolicus]
MKRSLAVVAVLALVPLGAGPAAAAPNIYHVISSTHGGAYVAVEDGCELTEVFLSSSVGMFAAQPGPVNKQGLTDVGVRITDTCGPVSAAAGGGGVVMFEARNMAKLVADPRLRNASVSTTMEGTDADGNPVTMELDAAWIGTGELEHTVISNPDHFPEGNVVAVDNNLRRDAVADISVKVAGRSVSGTDPAASLELVKANCVEVARPGVEGFFPCFGFPG